MHRDVLGVLARTRKRKVAKDPTKEAHIDSFRSAAITHNVCAPSAAFDTAYISFRYPHRLYETVLLGNTAPDSHYSDSATPLHPRTLRGRVLEMVGVYPGKQWVRHFISRHPDILMAKPRGLDPKRAQNFNKATITEYFDMRVALNSKYGGMSPEQNWNVDEKGCQMGGGRNGDNSKFIFSKYNC